MTKILAIETSTQNCSVSIQGDGCDILVEQLAPQQHAQLILPMVDSALKQAELSASDIDFLAFGQGPGAFTGLRIAAGVVQGLSLGWNKPVIGVSSLQALAYQGFVQTGLTEWSAIMDARMQEIYVENLTFDPQGRILSSSAPILVPLDGLDALNWFANGIGDVFESLPEFQQKFTHHIMAYPSAKPLAILASQYLDRACDLSEAMPQPIYLRASVTN